MTILRLPDKLATQVVSQPHFAPDDTASAVCLFLRRYDVSVLRKQQLEQTLYDLTKTIEFRELLCALVAAPIYSSGFSAGFAARKAVTAIAPCRILRGSLNLSVYRFFALLAEVFSAFDERDDWQRFADCLGATESTAYMKLARHLTRHPDEATSRFYLEFAGRLAHEAPHAIYPTSDYRESSGHTIATDDAQTIEAVMTVSTYATIKTVDHALDLDQPVLRKIYATLGRCICIVDHNVEAIYGAAIERYFAHHGIALHKRVYRAMEVDKHIATVERMLGDFKALGVSRNEPVLVVGGGVLADTAGLACSLYGRNTPYVMLSTSVVTGIDAGPSPRTCCDGYGYKNLLGAYHPPVVSITDRFFFASLHPGWVRHGIAEIIKMSIVKDGALFRDLEAAQGRLIETRFGTVDCAGDEMIGPLSRRIVGAALRAYVAAEYDNLYETHQCRPHAYGHTWSPGFELETGLLHGHAVSICMGFGAYLSCKRGWITETDLRRILGLLSGYGLTLHHTVLKDEDLLWRCQQIVTQKRGQNLVAPLPRGEIGCCDYLNDLSRNELAAALVEYRSLCNGYPRRGLGIEAYCHEVGLEDPAVVSA